jgi:hypothetical protein
MPLTKDGPLSGFEESLVSGETVSDVYVPPPFL